MRLFVAVEIDNSQILQKIKSMQESFPFKAKPVRIDQIHFTLKFLGEIDETKCEDVKKVLNGVAFSQFEISLKGVGGFPNLRNPRVVWVGVEKKGEEKLIALANEVEMKLTTLGFQKDKKSKPHLTIFRVKKKIDDISSVMKGFESMNFGTEIVSKIKLKKSVLSPKGPEYSDLLEVNAR